MHVLPTQVLDSLKLSTMQTEPVPEEQLDDSTDNRNANEQVEARPSHFVGGKRWHPAQPCLTTISVKWHGTLDGEGGWGERKKNRTRMQGGE